MSAHNVLVEILQWYPNDEIIHLDELTQREQQQITDALWPYLQHLGDKIPPCELEPKLIYSVDLKTHPCRPEDHGEDVLTYWFEVDMRPDTPACRLLVIRQDVVNGG